MKRYLFALFFIAGIAQAMTCENAASRVEFIAEYRDAGMTQRQVAEKLAEGLAVLEIEGKLTEAQVAEEIKNWSFVLRVPYTEPILSVEQEVAQFLAECRRATTKQWSL